MLWAQDWRWVNEGKSPERPKWGYVTEREGDSLTVRVRTLPYLIKAANVATQCRYVVTK